VGDRQAANQHARTRRDHATETAEDYVEAIGEYLESKGQCRVTDLAAHFAVSHVTVHRTIARLQRLGLVINHPYGPVELTDEGRQLATEARRRHEAVFQFLVALGVSSATAATDAEGIEHHVSDETLRAMKRYVLDNPGRRE
jgi:DtxR family transcriptional regulator, manganese transport regulator